MIHINIGDILYFSKDERDILTKLYQGCKMPHSFTNGTMKQKFELHKLTEKMQRLTTSLITFLVITFFVVVILTMVSAEGGSIQ